MATPGEDLVTVFARIRAAYKELTPEQRAPYEANAEVNRALKNECCQKAKAQRANLYANLHDGELPSYSDEP